MCSSDSAKRTLVVSMSGRQTRLPLVRQRVNYSDGGWWRNPILHPHLEYRRPGAMHQCRFNEPGVRMKWPRPQQKRSGHIRSSAAAFWGRQVGGGTSFRGQTSRPAELAWQTKLLSLKSLFELSEWVGVSPVVLFRNDPTVTFDLSQRTAMKPIKHHAPVSEKRLEDLRKVLDGIVRNGPHHLALTDVAKTLGEKYTFLRYRCPNECARISAAHLKFKSDNSKAKLAANVSRSRRIMMRLLPSKRRITRKIVRAELAAHHISIASPEVRAALRRAVSDFVNTERLRRGGKPRSS